MAVNYRLRNREKLLRPRSENSSETFAAKPVPLTEERFAILGHEIRNPLSALNSALQAWPTSGEDPKLAETLLQIMQRQVLQLTRLCNDLLDVGRNSKGSLSINRAAIDVGQVIQSACEEIKPLIEQCGHTMTVSISDFPLTVIGDESRLTQVFANLMHNSAKFTDRNGHLDISVDRDHETAVIRFRDNGRGICADALRTIFLPESVTKKCSSSMSEGLGIGLRLAKSIVDLHGGTIEAFSEGLGRGSTFVVRLPMASDKPKRKTRSASSTSIV